MASGKHAFDPRESFYRIHNGGLFRCFAPGVECSNPPIRAHSVQNARHLELLERQGHVVSIALRFEKGNPIASFEMKGRRQATTFTGLCEEHDAEIFRPVEQSELSFSDSEHLFLLAYRCVLRELHASAEGAAKVQTSYLERLDAGIEPRGQPSRQGMFALTRLWAAYDTSEYKSIFDKAYLSRDFDAVEHDVIRFENTRPSLAVAALFSIDHLPIGDDVVRVCLTILPVSENETIAIFSYLKREARAARGDLSRILDARGPHQVYEISRLVLNSCENFVIAPDVYESWTQVKREAILSYFRHTLFKDDREFESEHLYLLASNA